VARINLPSGKRPWLNPYILWRKNRWSRSTEYIKAAVEFTQRHGMNIAIPQLQVLQHYGGGMEYPESFLMMDLWLKTFGE
jgi:hypothetical protein